MSERVLFVDDDQMLLSSMERCLGLDFDLETAISGPDALELIAASEVFPVIVSDMRMPAMDGIQFIQKAREISKHSVFLMLTGNQDVQTAIRSVNEGQVFRFLNKPCDPTEIAGAIKSARRQYDLEAAERELLNKTFVGALAIFADVMETLQPELIGRAARTEQYMDAIRAKCGVAARWEYKVASKLLLLGFAMQQQDDSSVPTSKRASIDMNRACTIAAKMVERLPRMEQVAEIIRFVPATDGDITHLATDGEGDTTEIGAALLRVAHIVESLSHLEVGRNEAETEVRRALPGIYEPLLASAMDIYPEGSKLPEGVLLEIEDLRPGMVLQDNLTDPSGATLLRMGRKLSETHIQKLLAEKESLGTFEPVSVTKLSYRECLAEAQPA